MASAEARVAADAAYLDALLALIPPAFYFATNNDDAAKPAKMPKYAKHTAKQPDLQKANRKNTKRKRLDPNEAETVPDLLQQQQQQQDPPADADATDDADADAPPVGGAHGVDFTRSARTTQLGLVELREKLAQKLKGMRGDRGGDASARKAGGTRERKKPSHHRPSSSSARAAAAPAGAASSSAPADAANGEVVVAGGASSSAHALSFNRFDSGLEAGRGKKRKANDTRSVVSSEDAGIDVWTKALEKAGGIKQTDDPKRVRKALKKKERQKKKSTKEWNSRIKAVEKEKVARAQRRTQNLADRATKGKNKAKFRRERAGFEGKKQAFLN